MRPGRFPKCLILALLCGACCAFLGYPNMARADAPMAFARQVARDFQPLQATVLRLEKDNVVLDQGAAQGVHAGDLFEVFGRGQRIVDPGSEETIGYIKKPLAMVEVLRADDKTSVAHIARSSGPVSAGLPATRYGDMPAAFTGIFGQPHLSDLRQDFIETLPQLEWVEEARIPLYMEVAPGAQAKELDLLFYLDADSLKVYGPGMKVLRTYTLPSSLRYVRQAATETAQGGNATSVEAQSQVFGPGLGWRVDLNHPLGRLDGLALATQVVDLDGDGTLEVAYLMPDGFYVAPFRRLGPQAVYRFSGPGRLVGFSVRPGTGWVALNAMVDGGGLSSVVLRYQAGDVREMARGINFWLRYMDLDGDGVVDGLVGQSFDRETGFGPKVYLLDIQGGSLVYLDQLVMPKAFFLPGAAWADLNGNGVPELFLVDSAGGVRVYEGGEELWFAPAPATVADPAKRAPVSLVEYKEPSGKPYGLLFPVQETVQKTGVSGAWERLVMLRWSGAKYVLEPLGRSFQGEISGVSAVGGRVVFGLATPGHGKKTGPATSLYLVRAPESVQGDGEAD